MTRTFILGGVPILLTFTQAAEASSFDPTALTQSLILRDVGLFFSGYQDDILTSQYQRNMLATLTREVPLKDGEIWGILPNLPPSEIHDRWSRWVISETQRRTMYCVWGELSVSGSGASDRLLISSFGMLSLSLQGYASVTEPR